VQIEAGYQEKINYYQEEKKKEEFAKKLSELKLEEVAGYDEVVVKFDWEKYWLGEIIFNQSGEQFIEREGAEAHQSLEK